MAEKKADAAAAPAKDGEAKPAGKKKNFKLIIIAVVAILLVGGGAAAYFLTRPKADAEAAEAKDGKPAKEGDKKKEAEVQKPFFVEFEPFTVNMKDPEKFLQIKLTFQVKSADSAEAIKDLMPIVRAAVIPILSGEDPAELMTNAGKEKLTTDAAAASNKALAGNGMENAVDAVLITHMIIQ